MAITNPILSVGPTSTRPRNKQLILRQTSVAPPQTEIKRDVLGGLTAVGQPPAQLGQMCYLRDPSNSAAATMYVVVSIAGDLTWKEVKSSLTFIDGRTGSGWNPLVGLRS
jgi:hypothetical protein